MSDKNVGSNPNKTNGRFFTYDEVFQDRLILVTGVFRSGTSIFHRIVGSLEGCYNCFEPVCFSSIVEYMDKGIINYEDGKQLLHQVFFEDNWLHIIQGRFINFREKDDSYIGNYTDREGINDRWTGFPRRQDVIEHLRDNPDMLFVVKVVNMQPFIPFIRMMFKGVKIIITTRNCLDTMNSIGRKGFWENKNITRMYMDIKTEEKKYYGSNDVLFVNLEQLIQNPEDILKDIVGFVGKPKTTITDKNIQSVKDFKKQRGI